MKTLINIDNGKKIKILKISGNKTIRQYLQSLGIHIGDFVTLKESSFLEGHILLEIKGYDVSLGKGIASKIEEEVE